MDIYKQKYIKYKQKYILLKNIFGGVNNNQNKNNNHKDNNHNDNSFLFSFKNKEEEEKKLIIYNSLEYEITYDKKNIFIYIPRDKEPIGFLIENEVIIMLPETNFDTTQNISPIKKYNVHDLIIIIKKFIKDNNINRGEISNVAKFQFKLNKIDYSINALVYRLFTKDNLDEISIYRREKSKYIFESDPNLNIYVNSLFQNFKKKNAQDYIKELTNLKEMLENPKFTELKNLLDNKPYNDEKIKILITELNCCHFRDTFLGQIYELIFYLSYLYIGSEKPKAMIFCEKENLYKNIKKFVEKKNSIDELIIFFKKKPFIEKKITKDNVEVIAKNISIIESFI